MDGLGVLSFFNSTIPCSVKDTLARNNLSVDEVDLFVFHQASRIALDSLRTALKIPAAKMVDYLADTGKPGIGFDSRGAQPGDGRWPSQAGSTGRVMRIRRRAFLGNGAGGNVMSEIGFILDRLTALEDRPALFWRGQAFDGSWMAGQVRRDIQRLTEKGRGREHASSFFAATIRRGACRCFWH